MFRLKVFKTQVDVVFSDTGGEKNQMEYKWSVIYLRTAATFQFGVFQFVQYLPTVSC